MRQRTVTSRTSPLGRVMRSVRFCWGLRLASRPSTSYVSRPSSLQRRAVVPLELQRQHTHADKVAAVDALERLRDHNLHAKQARAFGRPVARGTGAVLLARNHDERRAVGFVTHGRVKDG